LPQYIRRAEAVLDLAEGFGFVFHRLKPQAQLSMEGYWNSIPAKDASNQILA
jgi:hypothetical protein